MASAKRRSQNLISGARQAIHSNPGFIILYSFWPLSFSEDKKVEISLCLFQNRFIELQVCYLIKDNFATEYGKTEEKECYQ